MKIPQFIIFGKQLFVGLGKAHFLGVGDMHSWVYSYMEGPTVTGSHQCFPMFGHLNDWTLLKTVSLQYRLFLGPFVTQVKSMAPITQSIFSCYWTSIMGSVNTNHDVVVESIDLLAEGEVKSNCGGHVLSNKKDFDIPHPTKRRVETETHLSRSLIMMFM